MANIGWIQYYIWCITLTKNVAYGMTYETWRVNFFVTYGMKVGRCQKIIHDINFVGVNTILVGRLEGFGICYLLYGIWRISKKETYGIKL